MSRLGSAVVLLSAAASVATVTEVTAEELYPAVFVLASSLGPNL